MNIDNLAKIDLNLLVTLQVLLEEESVTRAAGRLHLSQSALSKSLNRLRITFGDPLFLRSAHGLKPTTHALYLKEQLPNLLQGLYQVTLPSDFTPSNSQRHFTFSMIESAYETLLPYYIGPLLKQAPKIILDIYGWTEKSMQDLQQGQIDFAITARDLHPISDYRLNNLPEGITQTSLFTDQQTCLVRKNHPILSMLKNNTWNMDAYLNMSHIQVRCEGKEWWALDYHLAELNQHRHINCTLPDFYGASSVCANSDLIFTLPTKFAAHAQKLHSLEQLPLPMEFTSMVYVLLWHKRNDDEPGHQWIRKAICENVAKAMHLPSNLTD